MPADEKVAKATHGVAVAEGVAPLRAAGDPIMGPTVLTAAEMAAWLRSSGASPRLSGGVSVEQIAQMYVDEGTAENVRGDVAFAQANIETGGFSAGGSDNNFSGLGACNGCGGQNRFPTALDGIRAQIQLLKAYAGGGPLVNPPSPYWWGPNPGAYDNFGGRGSATGGVVVVITSRPARARNSSVTTTSTNTRIALIFPPVRTECAHG